MVEDPNAFKMDPDLFTEYTNPGYIFRKKLWVLERIQPIIECYILLLLIFLLEVRIVDTN